MQEAKKRWRTVYQKDMTLIIKRLNNFTDEEN
jgi:hypothetical protein